MRKMQNAAVAIIWVLIASAARGQSLQSFAGTWVMRLGARNVFVLTLTPDGNGVKGSFERPTKLTAKNLIVFSSMSHSLRNDSIVDSRFNDGVLHFTVRNANDTKDEDKYAMTVKGDQAELTFDDLPLGTIIPSYLFERAPSGAKVATDWEPNRAYVVGDSDVPSAEMKSIFAEDQRVRMGKIDFQSMKKTDVGRREQTRALLMAGALHTGKDYEEAAFVLQHGDSAQDYLLAHTLSMVAVSKGDVDAIWIAAATLDRYLEKVGQKQIFGTQFLPDPKSGITQEPYDRGLVSDALRQQLGVPSQAEQGRQEEQLKAQQAQK